MAKPSQDTRKHDQYKRQLHMLETYIKGRIVQLETIAKQQPGEESACNMATSELQTILSQVLPQMREVQS